MIPQVIGVAPQQQQARRSDAVGEGIIKEPFSFPTACPACGTPVVKEEVRSGEEGRDRVTKLRTEVKNIYIYTKCIGFCWFSSTLV